MNSRPGADAAERRDGIFGRWIGLLGAHRPLLTRTRFAREVRWRQRWRNRHADAALLLIELDGLADAQCRWGVEEVERCVNAIARIVATAASDCRVTSPHRGVFAVYCEDVTRTVNLAEAIRDSVEKQAWSFNGDARVAADPASPRTGPTVAIGACKLAPRQEWLDAIRLAEDALLSAKQAGGNQVLWHRGAA